MRLEDIVKLPVPDLTRSGSHLWMWSTNATIPHACWLIQKWGFTHMNVITWVKESGWGFWWANCTEHLFFAYRGKLKMNKKYMLTAFHQNRSRVHSRKPDQQWEYIESISDGPYLEMFARRPREGWDVWGNEVEGVDIWEKSRSSSAST